MTDKRPDALAEIEEALNAAADSHPCGCNCLYCHALSLLPRLRAVVEAAGDLMLDAHVRARWANREDTPRERNLVDALAALDGEEEKP